MVLPEAIESEPLGLRENGKPGNSRNCSSVPRRSFRAFWRAMPAARCKFAPIAVKTRILSERSFSLKQAEVRHCMAEVVALQSAIGP